MRKIFVKNIRLIIICITLIAIISIMCFSYAYGSGSNAIYTRDELSERINELEKHHIFLTATVSNITSNDSLLVIPYDLSYNSNTEIFGFLDNKIIIKKTGKYFFSSYISFVMNENNGYSTIVSNYNNDVGLTFDGDTNIPIGGHASHMSDIYTLNAGDTIYVKYYTSVSSNILFAKMNIVYLGEL